MGLEYFAFYAEASLVCVVILVMLILQNNSYGTRTVRRLTGSFCFSGRCFQKKVRASVTGLKQAQVMSS